MTVEIICVGTELLLGNIVNTNAAYLARQCADLGLSCYYQSVVGDNAGRLTESVKTALKRSDILLISGGLGPTQDDLTKETVAGVLGKKLVSDVSSRRRIEEYFAKKNIPLTENNWKQAYVPEGCTVLDNDNGTAPGMIVRDGERHIVLLPGPPGELEPMFQKYVRPYLAELEPGVILSQTVKICGVGESAVETMVRDLIEEQSNPTIATYAKIGEVHLRVTAKAEDEKAAKRLIKPIVRELKTRFGEDIYTTNEGVTLEKEVADLLTGANLTITTAESCTGGMLASRLINVPGISQTYKAGYVTYSNKSKRRLLGVKKAALEKYGAVSQKVAEEMVKGAALAAKTDVAVALTGIAGPDGGSQEKPAGLVYIACQVCGKMTVKEYFFQGDRAKVRESATAYALILMRKCILEYYGNKTFGKEKDER